MESFEPPHPEQETPRGACAPPSEDTAFAAFRDRVTERVLAELPEHVARLGADVAMIEARRIEGLRSLLRYAVERSPFHARRLEKVQGFDPDRCEIADLGRLPVMRKSDMMASFDDVLTCRGLGRARVEDALARTRSQPVVMESADVRCISIASGGSSGVRGVFVYDDRAFADFVLALSRRTMARILQSGGVPPGGILAALVAAPTAVHATGCAPAVTNTDRAPFRYRMVPATLPQTEIIARLEALQAPALYGYPSVLARLAEARRGGRLNLSPLVVACTSETLTPALRAQIRGGFGVPIVDTFGSSEGLCGMSEPDSDVLVFNSDQCIVELVDDDYRPVAPGARAGSC